MIMIMSSVIISFKNMSVTKLLQLQDETMSSPYDKQFYPGYNEHYITVNTGYVGQKTRPFLDSL